MLQKLFATTLIGFAVTASTALADTRVFVTNLTGETIAMNAITPTGGLKAGAWRPGASWVGPGARTEVLRFNRADDVKNGRDYVLTTQAQVGDTPLELRQFMRGTAFHSKMWWSVAGPNLAHPWIDQRGATTASFPRTNSSERVMVTYSAYGTGGDDDIEYVVTIADPLPQPTVDTGDTLSVLAWNIQMLPEVGAIASLRKAQADRIGPLVEAINAAPRYDAIVISEAFDDSMRDQLIKGIAVRYPFRTKVVGKNSGLFGINQDGGAMIFSRHPIERVEESTFGQICDGDDCRADKGVIYARINKAGRKYHVFGSHLQASYVAPPEPKAVTTRQDQFRVLRRLVDALAIPASEPVIIAGDLNVNGADRTTDEYIAMLSLLSSTEPTRGVRQLSSDSNANSMTGRGERAQMLDYVLTSSTHLRPLAAETRVIRARAAQGYSHKEGDIRFHMELSDHFPVLGLFSYPLREPIDFCTANPRDSRCKPIDPIDPEDGCRAGPRGKVCE